MNALPRPTEAASCGVELVTQSELLLEKLKLASELQRRLSRNKLSRYKPYLKQREFHAAGATYRERLLMTANQVGKSYCGAAEAAYHLTGKYPEWWEGRRWNRPVRACV